MNNWIFRLKLLYCYTATSSLCDIGPFSAIIFCLCNFFSRFLCLSTFLVCFYLSWNFRIISQNTFQQHPENIPELFNLHFFFCVGGEKKNHSNNVTVIQWVFLVEKGWELSPLIKTVCLVAELCFGLLKQRCQGRRFCHCGLQSLIVDHCNTGKSQ